MTSSGWRPLLIGALMLVAGLVVGCTEKEGVHKIQPNFGNVAGNDDVVLVGKGFKAGLTVRFGKRTAKHIVIESDTKVRLKTPSGPEGAVDVTLTDETGKSLLIPKGFTYRKLSR